MKNVGESLRSGAVHLGGGRTSFRVWAPLARRVEVHVVEPEERLVPMEPEAGHDDAGWFHATVESAAPGTLYRFRLDGAREFPDPASRSQPRGVHGPSEVLEREHEWRTEGAPPLDLARTVIYELHVGTFTEEGTFDAVEPHLDGLVELGVTAIELMPVCQFPGRRNWGYDGVYPFCVQDSYGGAAGLKRLVDACHARGLAVVLDVVTNHLGPEGNYLREFGPYFTSRYRTPWGDSLNFDGPGSGSVRRFFVESALEWVADYRIDALRLDAVHAIVDESERTFLEELTAAVHEEGRALGRPVRVIGESANNTLRFLRPREHGGCGMDAQWSDDFHHALHALLTGESAGYYRDFGRMEHLARALSANFAYSGHYSPYRSRRHGADASALPPSRFVVCAQNHDQVGNRPHGERLASLLGFEQLKLAAGAVLLSPFVPLLFMGEEYGEPAPFLYFVDHGDPALVDAVRAGRRREFEAFRPGADVPDPAAEETFARSRLDRRIAEQPRNAALRQLHRDLLLLRREVPALAGGGEEAREVRFDEAARIVELRRTSGTSCVRLYMNFSPDARRVAADLPAGEWRSFRSADPRYGGEADPEERPSEREVPLPPWSFVLLIGERA